MIKYTYIFLFLLGWPRFYARLPFLMSGVHRILRSRSMDGNNLMQYNVMETLNTFQEMKNEENIVSHIYSDRSGNNVSLLGQQR